MTGRPLVVTVAALVAIAFGVITIISGWRALLIEAVGTFLFLLVVVTVVSDDTAAWKGVLAPTAIGGFIFTAALTLGAFSSGSFNPARSIDPAIWAVDFGDIWIFIIGPLLGAMVAGIAALIVRGES